MIDDDVRAIKRRVFVNKFYFALFFLIYCCLWIIPLLYFLILKTGMWGAISVLVSLLVLAFLIIAVSHRCLWSIRELTGALPIEQVQSEELESLSEDMTIATGRPFPELLLIDDKHCCNLFSIKRRGHAVIFMGRGLLNRLDPDELRVAIAHEMAHIYNGDAGTNTLTVAFRAFIEEHWPHGFYSAGLILGIIIILIFFAFIGSIYIAMAYHTYIVTLLLLPITFPPVFLFVLGQLLSLFLPAIILKRDLFADELAVKWTLQPEALISAMQTAQLHDRSKKIAFLENMPFVPTISVNPHKYMQSGSVEERVENILKAVHMPS